MSRAPWQRSYAAASSSGGNAARRPEGARLTEYHARGRSERVDRSLRPKRRGPGRRPHRLLRVALTSEGRVTPDSPASASGRFTKKLELLASLRTVKHGCKAQAVGPCCQPFAYRRRHGNGTCTGDDERNASPVRPRRSLARSRAQCARRRACRDHRDNGPGCCGCLDRRLRARMLGSPTEPTPCPRWGWSHWGRAAPSLEALWPPGSSRPALADPEQGAAGRAGSPSTGLLLGLTLWLPLLVLPTYFLSRLSRPSTETWLLWYGFTEKRWQTSLYIVGTLGLMLALVAGAAIARAAADAPASWRAWAALVVDPNRPSAGTAEAQQEPTRCLPPGSQAGDRPRGRGLLLLAALERRQRRRHRRSHGPPPGARSRR